MDTLDLLGRKADRFLRMGMSKKLGGFREWQRVYKTQNRLILPRKQSVLFLLSSGKYLD